MGPDGLVLNFEVDFFYRAAHVTSFEPFLLLESNMIVFESVSHEPGHQRQTTRSAKRVKSNWFTTLPVVLAGHLTFQKCLEILLTILVLKPPDFGVVIQFDKSVSFCRAFEPYHLLFWKTSTTCFHLPILSVQSSKAYVIGF